MVTNKNLFFCVFIYFEEKRRNKNIKMLDITGFEYLYKMPTVNASC